MWRIFKLIRFSTDAASDILAWGMRAEYSLRCVMKVMNMTRCLQTMKISSRRWHRSWTPSVTVPRYSSCWSRWCTSSVTLPTSWRRWRQTYEHWSCRYRHRWLAALAAAVAHGCWTSVTGTLPYCSLPFSSRSSSSGCWNDICDIWFVLRPASADWPLHIRDELMYTCTQ